METAAKTIIEITAVINAPVEKTWDYFTMPAHITHWNHASGDWYTPHAASDLKEGGRFKYRMEAKDGSMGFDFSGKFDRVMPNEYIGYTLDDGRKVEVEFALHERDKTIVTERFEAENTHPPELQKSGWQGILDSFRVYTESN